MKNLIHDLRFDTNIYPIRRIIYFILLFFLIFPGIGWAVVDNIYFVTQYGSGLQNGRCYTDAWSVSDFNNTNNWSMNENVKKIDPGDTVYICGNICSTLSIKQSGEKNNNIKIRGDFPEFPGTISSSEWCGILIRGKSHLCILNITIHDCGSNGITIDTYMQSDDVTGIIIDGVTSHSNKHNGIWVTTYDDIYRVYDVEIKNCVTYNNGSSGYRISGLC